jgi:DNA-binding MarR family transcriptional regulator
LSWLLIAYTIELDNEFEHRMAAVGRGGAFRASLVLWENFLRYVNPEGTRVGDLPTLAGIAPQTVHLYLSMERHGYVTVEPDRAHRPAGRPRLEWVVRRTAVGETAGMLWTGLDEVIERRWVERFGRAAVTDLRHSLEPIVAALGVDRPRYLPMVGFGDGMRIHALPVEDRQPARSGDGVWRPSLATLLSLVLLDFALEFELLSELSLALSANVLRALGDGVRRLRDLPRLTGVPRETVRASVSFLARQGYVVVETEPASRAKSAGLTPQGCRAHRAYPHLVEGAQARWEDRFGRDTVAQLVQSVHRILEQRDGDQARLGPGLVPYPEGWRASRPYRTQTQALLADPTRSLPHFPLVTHRGGWPDGS